MAASDHLQPEQFFHGSRSPGLKAGDTIRSWWRQSSSEQPPAGQVHPDNFFTGSRDEAAKYGPHVYTVEPTGPYEPDESRPDAYLSRHALKITGTS